MTNRLEHTLVQLKSGAYDSVKYRPKPENRFGRIDWAGQYFNFPVGEERIDVCKAIDDVVTDARNEGLNKDRFW